MPTFYQKYRPNNFAEVVNQNHIKITLQNELETGQTAHAYLFCGPRGTGKTTMARVFAKALNCEKRIPGESEPCSSCASCEQIKQGTSLDVVEIDAASHTGVDNVRENIIAGSRVSVTPGKYRIFIIDEVHMLSIAAFNALLKTLEEPPRQTVFILCTTEAHKLPATIISRCQRFDFKRISVADIAQKLKYIAGKEEVRVSGEILDTIARHSEGHMRDAESLLNQVFSISGKEVTQAKADLVIPRSNIIAVIDLIDYIAKKDAAQAIRLINQLVDEGVDLKQFNEDVVACLRSLMLSKISQNLAEKYAKDLGGDMELQVSALLESLAVDKLAEFINIFLEARTSFKNMFIVQLPLEIAVVKLCSLKPLSAPLHFTASAVKQTNASFPIVNNQIAAINVPVSEIQAKWNEVLLRVKKYNHSLSFILKVCEPREAAGGLCLAFKYKFHKDRIEQPAIRQILGQAMQEVFGAPVNFSAILDENLAIGNMPETESAMQNAPAATDTNPALAEQKIPSKQKDNSAAGNNGAADSGIDNILKMFGGKVVG